MSNIDTERKLGKKAGVVEDPRTFKLKPLLDVTDLPPIMDVWRIAKLLHDWPVFKNDDYGDCTCASLVGHRVRAQEWSSGRRDKIPVSDKDVLSVYSAVTGFDPEDPTTDNGAYLIDVLRYVRRYGFGREFDNTPHTVTAYARVDLDDHDEVRRAAHLFGGLYLGLALPERAMFQDVWDLPDGPLDERDEPYSWGGHAVWMVGYDTKYVIIITWGDEQRVTWRWFKKYCDEAWALISEDFINRLGRTPQGLNVDRLKTLLSSL